LLGAGDKTILLEGALHRDIHFVITADADTQLPPGTVRRMVETIAHPMNRVQIDEASGIRGSGYAIIQPRVGIALPGASSTRFTHLFADAQGTDPYSSAVSDAHQELFSEAMLHGKAIYDVPAFHQILCDRFPTETLLSHDLIEGAHVGVALASDIEVLENLSLDYPAFSRRQHRWIRGDWQIAAWAARIVPCGDGRRRPNPLSFINRWRILDNLRRSMVPLAALLLLGFGWFVSAVPAIWTVVLVLAVGTPALVQSRSRADPRIRAVEALLCERVPIARVEADDHVRARNPHVTAHVKDRVWTSRTTIPHVQLSSNGRYSLMITNNGGGYSRWNGQDVTRWRSDSARDRDGSYVWLRDLRGGPAWSPSPYPAGDVGDATVTFTADRAEFVRRFQDLEGRLEIAVATGDDVELRRLSINNRSVRTRHIEITTYMELALAPHLADIAHPLFAKMFVETEAPERGVLLAHRRPRAPGEAPVWVASVLAGVTGPIEFETDRYVFLGRNRDLRQAAETRNLFSFRTGAVLDPIFGFRAAYCCNPGSAGRLRSLRLPEALAKR